MANHNSKNNSKAKDELIAVVKMRLDDTSYDNLGQTIVFFVVCIIGVLWFMVECDRNIVSQNISEGILLSELCLFLASPLIMLINILEENEIQRQDRPETTTFRKKPFVDDNIIRMLLYILICGVICYLGDAHLGKMQIRTCTGVIGAMLGLEISDLFFKLRNKTEETHTDKQVFIVEIIIMVFLGIWILPEFTKALPFDLIRFYLGLSALIGCIYYMLHIFYLSPKRRLHQKLRACYNRLTSRDKFKVSAEELKFQQIVSGYTFSELYIEDFHQLYLRKETIANLCEQTYDYIDKARIDCTEEKKDLIKTAHKTQLQAGRLLEEYLQDLHKLNKNVIREFTKLPKTKSNIEETDKILRRIDLCLDDCQNEIESLNILNELTENKINQMISYLQAHPEYLCKYAIYKKRYGNFIGCRVIPRMDKLYQNIMRRIH